MRAARRRPARRSPARVPAPRPVDGDAEARQQHEHQQHERAEQQRRREAAHVLEPVAREQVHHDQPAGAVHQVLDEVRGPVAVTLEQRARRRRRVDHHRAARQQAEGGREEQSVLERLLLPRSGHSRRIRQHGPDASRWAHAASSCVGAGRAHWTVRRDGPGRADYEPSRPSRASGRAAHERLEVLAALLERAVLVVGGAGG